MLLGFVYGWVFASIAFVVGYAVVSFLRPAPVDPWVDLVGQLRGDVLPPARTGDRWVR